MDWSLYEDPQTGRFKPKKLSITKSPIKIKEVTDLYNMRQDLKGLPMDEAKLVFKQFFNDEYAHELEVEELEVAFNRATKATLGKAFCFKGHFSAIEELLDMHPGIESIPLPLSEAQTHQAVRFNLIKRWTPTDQEEWESLLLGGYKATELKAMMIENGLEPKGRKADLARDLAAFAMCNPEKMPPSYEFLPGDELKPALQEAITNMVRGLKHEIENHPYYYQFIAWQGLLLEWPSHEWPWLPELIKSHGGAPAAAAVSALPIGQKVSSSEPFEPDDWKGSATSTARLEIAVPEQKVEPPSVTSTPQPAKPSPSPAPSKSESTWAANDFDEPIEVLFKYQGERDSAPKERHVQIERVSTKGGRVFLKGMCLKSQGMKMFMVDRIKGDIVSPITGELVRPSDHTRVEILREALQALAVAQPVVTPVIDAPDNLPPEAPAPNKPPGKLGIMRRFFNKLGLKNE